MESRVIFQDGMDNDPADYNDLQDYVQKSLDDIVYDSIINGRGFAGFLVTKSGPTSVSVAVGRLYQSGAVFAKDSVTTFDFTSQLPVATKKYVTIVVWGQSLDTDTRPREFLINEETGATEARTVALERARICNVQAAYAPSESPNPEYAILDANVLGVAHVLLTPTGVDSVVMLSANEVPNLDEVDGRLQDAEAFIADAAPRIASLASDISALANGQRGRVSIDIFQRTLGRVALLEAKSGIPSNAADSSADFFLDTDGMDLAFSGSSIKVDEGLRLPDAAANSQALQLFNPIDAAAMIKNGVLFPAYDRVLRQNIGPRIAEAQISAYSYQTYTAVQKMMSRLRIRYGATYTYCTNSAFWQTGNYDPITHIFSRAGETFVVLDPALATQDHVFVRITKFWYDTYSEAYWDIVTAEHTITGAQIAETFPVGQDMWVDAIGVYFTRLAASGAVNVLIVECNSTGVPDLTQCIAKVTVDRADLKLAPTETVIPFGPTFLEAGKRYAIVIITAADHWVGMAAGTSFTQGTFFYVLDGAYAQGDATRDLAFKIYTCQFRLNRSSIQLTPLSLSGGIASIDINADVIIPKSTKAVFEVQVSGVWYAMDDVTPTILGAGGSIPPLLPFRCTFVGSPEVMPAIRLTDSVVDYFRAATTGVGISAIRTLPASSTQIRVMCRLENYDDVVHDLDCKLLTDAGYATSNNAASIVDVENADGSLNRTFVFNLGSGVTTFRKKFLPATSDALNVFHVAWTQDWAL